MILPEALVLVNARVWNDGFDEYSLEAGLSTAYDRYAE